MNLQGIGRAEAVVLIFARDQIDILPNRNAVDAPGAAQRPARQRLAGIPFALSVSEAVAPGAIFLRRRRMRAKPRVRFIGPSSIDVPLRTLWLVDADEGRLAAHGQAHILRLQVRVDAMRHLFDLQPILLR